MKTNKQISDLKAAYDAAVFECALVRSNALCAYILDIVTFTENVGICDKAEAACDAALKTYLDAVRAE